MNMQKSLLLLLASLMVCAPESEVTANGVSLSKDNDPLVELFDLASKKNVSMLESMREAVNASTNKTLKRAYPVALFIAAPSQYEQEFVETFPVDHKGLMEELYGLELKQLTPRFLYSVIALGKIANKGHEKAIQKVLQANVHSDGVVGELLCENFTNLLQNQPQKTLIKLSALSANDRGKNYSCFKLLSPEDFKSLKKRLGQIGQETSDREKAVVRQIELYPAD